MDKGDVEKLTVVTIDDDSDVREALRVVLESEGFAVHEAENAETGLALVKELQPSAVLVDLMMEEIDSGVTIAKELQECAYSGPVFLLSSAGDTVRYNIDPKEIGLAGVFQKPIHPGALIASLKTRLDLVKNL